MRSYSITLIFANFQKSHQLYHLHCNVSVFTMLYRMTHLECYLFNLYYNLYYLGENIKDYQRISN